ncbi:MAG: hypothetical protein LBR88_01585, partial [Zoogloeaceae bacterium]|nr:hypothetical protein [Zoogloeaceae bacterium]
MTSPFFYRLVRQAFPYTITRDHYTLRTNDNGSPAMLSAIMQAIREDDKEKHGKQFYRLPMPEGALFFKRKFFDSSKRKLRLTLGKFGQYGSLDWPLEEIRNTVAVNALGIESPLLRGYGVLRGKWGLVEEVHLLFDFLEGYTSCNLFLDASNDKAKDLKTLNARFFDLIYQMHQKGVAHLDLSPKNVMLPTDGNIHAAQVIDFEICHIAP